MAREPKTSAAGVLSAVNEADRDLDINRLAEQALDAFGGSEEFFQKLYREYSGDKTSSIARTKMLESVLRLLTAAAAKKPPAGDTAGMTDEELEAALARLIQKRQLNGEPDGRSNLGT